jgi:lipopolysaccharide transport system permease protein
MIMLFNNIVRYRTLLVELTIDGIKARYKGTVLGVLWAIAQPLMLSAFCIAGFSRMWGGRASVSYPLFVYSSMVVWTLFATAVSNGVSSLTQNSHLIKKIYFPREILVLAAVAPPLVDFLFSFLLLMSVLIYSGILFHKSMLFLPMILAVQMSLILGISFAGSLLNVILPDVSRALPIALTGLMFLSPVLYSYDTVGGEHRMLYLLNPLGGIVESFRNVLLDQRAPDTQMFLIPLLMSLIFLALGYRIFKYGESIMADVL